MMAQFKHFKCKNCGFEFEVYTDFENMDQEEFEEIASCPCGEQTEEVMQEDKT